MEATADSRNYEIPVMNQVMTNNATTAPIRVVVVHNHQIMLEGLRLLVDSCPRTIVVGTASNCAAALRVVATERPDIVLVDFDSDGNQGIGWLSELCNASTAETRLIVLTHSRDAELHHQVMGLGAAGIVNKETSAEHLSRALERVHAGEIWLDRATVSCLIRLRNERDKEGMIANPEAAKIRSLTNREREVITLVGEGLKAKQIASRLFISETTVRHHLTTIFSKLEVSDRFELLIYAFKHGLADPPCRQIGSAISKAHPSS